MKIEKTLLSLDEKDREMIKKTGTFIIPSDINKIAGSVFFGCKDLKTITIPESVSFITKFAFYDCRNLKSVKFCSTPQINWDAFANTNIREVVLTEELSHNTEFRYDLRNILGRQIRFAVEVEEEME